MTQALLFYFASINLVAFCLSILDKGFAVYNRRRVSEYFLLSLSFAGGAAGAKLAQLMSGHKKLKVDFCASLSLIAFLQLGIAAAIWSETVRTEAMGAYDRIAASFEFENESATEVTPVADAPALPMRFGPGS